MARHEGQPVSARAADLQTIYQAVRAGFGRALLPIATLHATRRLRHSRRPRRRRGNSGCWWSPVRQIRRVSLTLGWVEAVVRDAFPPEKANTGEILSGVR